MVVGNSCDRSAATIYVAQMTSCTVIQYHHILFCELTGSTKNVFLGFSELGWKANGSIIFLIG
jgi:hypothetical protein